MSLDMTPVHRNLHTKVTFLGLEFEDLILVLALAALTRFATARRLRRRGGVTVCRLRSRQKRMEW
jgi:hypothetical protein